MNVFHCVFHPRVCLIGREYIFYYTCSTECSANKKKSSFVCYANSSIILICGQKRVVKYNTSRQWHWGKVVASGKKVDWPQQAIMAGGKEKKKKGLTVKLLVTSEQ